MYWIKDHPLDILLAEVDGWLIHPYMVIKKDKITQKIKYRKGAEAQSLSDNFEEKLSEYLQAKDKFPVLKRILTHREEYLEDIDKDLIWELTTLDKNAKEIVLWADAHLLGWLFYHLGIKKNKTALNHYIWMVSLEKKALSLLENGEICAMVMLIRNMMEELENEEEYS